MHSFHVERPILFGLTTDQLRNGLVWCLFAVSFIVSIEPAPVDVVFLLLIPFFLLSGFSPTVGAMPMVVFLLLYNLGGFIGLAKLPHDVGAPMFVTVSFYMALVAIVFAYYIAVDPIRRGNIMRNGWIVGACIAALLGILDYFHVPIGIPMQILPGRAAGLFKDPNVFSTYLVFPMVALLQLLLLGQAKRPVLVVLAFGVLTVGLFLSFSRGAWLNFLMAAVMMTALLLITNTDLRLRLRVFVYFIVALILGVVALSVLLSIPDVRDMFLDRFTLVKSYDAGETGRFGNQLRSLPVLAREPLGLGPLTFRMYYGIEPHNVFINAFSSYGWLGGISYVVLTITTIAIGFRAAFAKSPWQNLSITVFCSLLAMMFQGVQIDTDHWRHFYWLLGMMWGLFAATLQPNLVVNSLGIRPLRPASAG